MNRLLWLFLIVTRLRDRLRCPSCSAVGTYKIHAPGDGRPWRWLCKWCGHYDGPEGKGLLCCPSPSAWCWVFRTEKQHTLDMTPQEVMVAHLNRDSQQRWEELKKSGLENVGFQSYSVWPWRG